MNQLVQEKKYAYKGWCFRMTTIVVPAIDKVKMGHSLCTTQIIDSISQKNSDIAITTNNEIVAINKIMPFNKHSKSGDQVYFDLVAYPFFERIHAAITVQEDKCGVLRFRRSGPSNESIGDLVVLSQLFGQITDVHHVNREIEGMMHSIILCRFGDQVIAHIEYTSSSSERIEFEFSSPHQIIEFDSAENVPTNLHIHPKYSIDCILKFATELNDSLLDLLRHVELQLGGEGV